jgi:3-phosphoshikimate 1-carboxyvinyltransferase
LSAPYQVQPQSKPFDGPPVKVPGSKSITNRALIVASLAQGDSLLGGALFSDDSRHMVDSLNELGVSVQVDHDLELMRVQGAGHPPKQPLVGGGFEVFVGNAGTAARFLPCLVAAGDADVQFKGDPRMSQRPMGELLGILAAQGAELSLPESKNGGPMPGSYPFRLHGKGLRGGAISLNVDHSSQFASGLLMAAPYAKSPVSLTVSGERQHIPYVDMTAEVMRQFGVAVRREGNVFHVPQGQYQAIERYGIEPDLSAAAYFFAATTLIGGKVTVLGTQAQAMQGDIRFLKVLQHLGASFYQDEQGLTLEKDPATPIKGGLTVDMNAFSDQALTLAAMAPFADGPITVKNVAHIREQECDRIKAAVENLKLLGIQAEEQADGFTVHPGVPKGASLPSYGDHRVAMAFSLVGLKVPGVSIQDPGCVAKTFADYWQALEAFQAGRPRA